MVKRTLNSIKSLLTREQHEIVSAASVLMVLTLISKITGLLLQSLIAKEFGASKQYDLFLLASVIPETITNIVLIGAVSGSIIPIFMKVKEQKGENEFVRSFNNTFNISIFGFLIISVLAGLFARYLIPGAVSLGGGHAEINETDVEQIILMMRLLLVPQVLLIISTFIASTLNIYHRFIIPQLAPIFFNIGRLAGVVLFVPLLGNSVWGLVWGSILGSILHLVVQVPLLSHLGLKFKLTYVDIRDKYFRDVLKLGLPRIFSLGAEQLASVIDSIIAFGLTVGSLSAYTYAVRLLSLPLSMFGSSFAVASFPSLSKLYARGANEEFQKLVIKLINQIMFLTIPVAIILLALRVPIVRLVYGIFGDNFTWEDTLQVSWVVMFFTIGVSFEAMRGTFFRVYYAIHNSLIPLLSSILVMGLGALSGILFTNYFSHFDTFSLKDLTWNASFFLTKGTGVAAAGGLALSSSLVFTIEFFFLLYMLKQKGAISRLKPIFQALAKKFFVALIMLLITYSMAKMWEQLLDTARTLQLFILTSTTSLSAFMLYLWISFVFKVEEVEFFMSFLARNLQRFRKKV